MTERIGRHYWGFTFIAGDLATYAEQRFNHHQSRWEFWRTRFHALDQKLRTEGITIHDRVQSGGNVAELKLDPTIARDRDEASWKVLEHDKERREFFAWMRLFQSEVPEREYEISYDDALHFHIFGQELDQVLGSDPKEATSD